MSEFWDLHTDFSKEQKVQNQMEKRDCIPMVQEVGGHQAKKLFFFVCMCVHTCVHVCVENRDQLQMFFRRHTRYLGQVL